MTRPDPTDVLVVDTGQGPARVWRHDPGPALLGTLVLGHGAGGGTDAADLQALVPLADDGWRVLLVDQPWRVAGRRIAVAPARLDAAWVEVLVTLRERGLLEGHLVVGGRSAGARVACRTATGGGTDAGQGSPRAAGVLALAFPLRPPARPERSRAGELIEPGRHGIPVLVVQGERDPFGGPDDITAAVPTLPDGSAAGLVTVVGVRGTHSPSPDLDRVRSAAGGWLADLS